VIAFSTQMFETFAAVQWAMAQVGRHVVITFDAADTLTLERTKLGSITEDDFLFVA
jgi:hypothetical protein